MRESHDDEVREDATNYDYSNLKCGSIEEAERLEEHRLHTVPVKTSGSSIRARPLHQFWGTVVAPSGFRLILVSRKDPSFHNWYFAPPHIFPTKYIHHSMTSNYFEYPATRTESPCQKSNLSLVSKALGAAAGHQEGKQD